MTKRKLPPVYFDPDSVSVGHLISFWRLAATNAGWPKEEIDRVVNEARSGDYDYLYGVISANSSDAVCDGECDNE